MKNLDEQIKKVNQNIQKYFTLFENGKMTSTLITDKIALLEQELQDLQERKKDLDHELSKPTIREVELFFDTTKQDEEFVLTYGKVHRNTHNACNLHLPSDGEVSGGLLKTILSGFFPV